MANNKANPTQVLKYFSDIKKARQGMIMDSYLNGGTTNTEPKKKKKLFKSEQEIARDNPSRYARMWNRYSNKKARKKNREDKRYNRRSKMKDAVKNVKKAFTPSQQQLERRAGRKSRRSNLGRGGGEGCVMGKCNG